MKMKRIAALFLALSLVVGQEGVSHFTVQAQAQNESEETLGQTDASSQEEGQEEKEDGQAGERTAIQDPSDEKKEDSQDTVPKDGTETGAEPGAADNTDPGEESGEADGADPGTEPGEADNTDPGTEPGAADNTDPGTEPEETDGTGQGQETAGQKEELGTAGRKDLDVKGEADPDAKEEPDVEKKVNKDGEEANELGNEIEAPLELDEEALAFQEAKEAFQAMLLDHDVYALLYGYAEAEILDVPGGEGKAVVTIPTGHQVRFTDVELVDGIVWYQVEAMVGGTAYIGYLAYDMVVSADGDFADWKETWLPEAALFSVGSMRAGSTNLSLFPESYRASIQNLINAHPNWTFVPMETGLDWNTVIKNEMYPGRALVPATSDSAWIASYTNIEPGWVQATESIVRHYMDPRNFLNETSVFQFELLSFNSKNHTESGVKAILKNTFMSGDIPGENITYSKAFMQIGKEVNVSPYHLASRVRQEQGTGGTSQLISGTYPGYEGYYNYFNILATGGTKDEIIRNGLQEAVAGGWNTRYKALKGGAEKVAKNYISVGQDTLYLQKFDVDNSDGKLYWHQYMTNLLAADNEGKSVRKGYEEIGIINNSFVFRIPIYKNMPSTACAMPTNIQGKSVSLKASVKDYGKVSLSWGELSGAQGYQIFRSESKSGKYTEVANITSVGTTSWSQDVEANKTYYYKIRGYKTLNGATYYSNESAVVSVSTTIPKPTWDSLKASSYTKVAVKWKKTAGVTGYQIYRKEGKNGTYQRVATVKGAATVSYNDTSVLPNTTYYYKIRSYVTVNGTNKYSSHCAEKSVSTKMAKVAWGSVKASSYTKVAVKWKKDANVTGYQIYRKEGKNGTYKRIKTIKGASTVSYNDTSALPNKTYYYKVRSYVTANGVNKYSAYNAEKSVSTKMATPSVVSATLAGNTSISLKWEAEKWVSGYRIYRAETAGGKYKLLKDVKGSKTTSYTDKSLEANGTYYYKIRSYVTVNGSRKYSPYSNEFMGKTKLTVPKISSASVTSPTKVKLKWKKTASATGYQIYRATSYNGKYTRVKTISKNTTVSFTDSQLVPNKTYYYKVRAYSKVGKNTKYSKYSPITGISPTLEEPAIQAISAVTAKSATIQWNQVEDAEGYRLYRSETPSGSYQLVKTLSGSQKNSYQDSGLKKGKTYYYKVRSYVKVNGAYKYSSYSDIWSVQARKK